MHVKPEVSSGSVNPETGLPEEETTEVETDVLLYDGQGMVIGGLIQERDTNIQSKIPFLGDLALVGALFQRRQVVKLRSEIIVVIIPHILPFRPGPESRELFDVHRTMQPLTAGAIYRYPRPYEPRMPDTFYNPRPIRLPAVHSRTFRRSMQHLTGNSHDCHKLFHLSNPSSRIKAEP